MNVISLPENVGQQDPLSKGVLPEVTDATIVCRFNDADEVERALDRARRRRDHPRADPAQHRRRAAAAGLPRAAARAGDEARHGADLRRGDHRLPPRARRLPVDRRRHARPDDDGQGDGQRLARLGARRQGRADGPLLHHARPARVLRRHVQRPSADRRRRARDDRQAAARAGARARLPARRADAARAARALRAARRAGRTSAASARSSSRTSSRGAGRATTTCSRTTSTCSSATAAS